MGTGMTRYLYDASGNLVNRAIEDTVAPPKIVAQPVGQLVKQDDFATFSVVVSDARGVTYQWRFNGTDIPGATNDSLMLEKVTPNDTGQYSVKVTNSAGSAISTPATLQLDDGTPGSGPVRKQIVAYSDVGGNVTVTPMKLSYELGESVTLTAAAFPPYVFVGWSGISTGDLATVNPITITADADKSIRARFATAAPLPPGLVAFWRGDVAVRDVIGGHDGKFFVGSSEGLPTLSIGKVGDAFEFTGAQHIRVHDDPVLLRPAQITVEAWVLPTDFPFDFFSVIVGRSSSWQLAIHNAKPFFSLTVSGNSVSLQGTGELPLNKWTHLAGTFDGTVACLYVNGTQVDAARQFSGDLTYDPFPFPVTIGAVIHPNLDHLFTGRIDEVCLYRRALTPAEIADAVAADFLGKNVAKPYFISDSRLPNAVSGVAYSQQIVTILGTQPVTFTLTAGSMPPGVSLSPTGAISGTPNDPGLYGFTVIAADSSGESTEQLLLLQVNNPVAHRTP